ncbi:myelin-oligodendrocyte glycoprotein, partial [Etheostoma spectabile]|uniref:myelin-oligodendrocyte glycoprotein n=1 Tax=Etheostoma spectabile TaxID=54343 RepID=UPI0013AFADC0
MDHVFVLCFAFTLWPVLVPFSPAAGLQTDGKDRPRVVGASQPIVAVQGDDVILPCHVEPQLDVEEMTVDWFRPDVPPDPGDPLSNCRYVHSYQDKQHEEDMKKASCAGRTEMFPDGLRHGNISLKIRDVRRSDRGLYRCQVPHLWSDADIKLNVEPRYVETTKKPQHP